MKTLDEVIKALEYCTGLDFVRCQDCPGYLEPECGTQDDALHYLKEYQCQAKNFDYDELQELRDWYAEEQLNPPLIWSELEQMEGKPVWIESKDKNEWIIPRCVDDGILIFDNFRCLGKTAQGEAWQAYRKERK